MDGKTGFKAEFFNNREHRGTPIWTQYDKKVDFFTANQHQTLAKFPPGVISSRWTSVLTPAKTGEVCFEVTNIDGGFRLFINDVEVLERGYQEIGVEHYYFQAKAGEKYNIRFEHSQGNEGASVSLATVSREKRNQDELLRKIAPADVIVFVGGLSPALEGEEMWVAVPGFKGGDRTSINLPAVQTELMKKLKATGKPVVFVMLTGSALAVTWEDENIPAIVNAWYGGQAAGQAIADVIFGDYNPAGRLPVTFYRSVEDLPDFEEYSMRNRTYRYFTGTPVYPFGYGLSYTTFQYSSIDITPVSETQSFKIKATVTNTGKKAGDEVVQLYLANKRDFVTPIRSLKGFKRIRLNAGESQTVEFILTPEDLSVVSPSGGLTPMKGNVLVSIGGGQPSDVAVDNQTCIQKNIIL
jgi:beta-glucosidase